MAAARQQVIWEGDGVESSVGIRITNGASFVVNGKSDAQVICVDPVLDWDNVTLVTNAHVQRLETDPSGGAVTGVVTQLGDGSVTTFATQAATWAPAESPHSTSRAGSAPSSSAWSTT